MRLKYPKFMYLISIFIVLFVFTGVLLKITTNFAPILLGPIWIAALILLVYLVYGVIKNKW